MLYALSLGILLGSLVYKSKRCLKISFNSCICVFMCKLVQAPKESRIGFGYCGAGVSGGCVLQLPDMDTEN